MFNSASPSGLLVTFSGIDCAGKSTQIARLAESLGNAGVRHTVVWFRPGYSPMLDELRRRIRRARPGLVPGPGDTRARERAFSRPIIQKAWIATALADLLAQYALRIRALLATGAVVVCDRYVFDARLDLVLRFPDAARSIEVLLDVCEKLCPTPEHAFLLMLPREEMLRRMELKNEPFPDAPDVRNARFDEYARLSTSEEITVLDATRSIEDLQRAIRDRVFSRIRSNPKENRCASPT